MACNLVEVLYYNFPKGTTASIFTAIILRK